jgi:hypothetical protein
MAKIKDVCRHVRSKNAGPFWVTVDFFFASKNDFERYSDSPSLQPERIAPICETQAAQVRRVSVPDLWMVKVTYPRRSPQGGVFERDLHSGQQYARFLEVEL